MKKVLFFVTFFALTYLQTLTAALPPIVKDVVSGTAAGAGAGLVLGLAVRETNLRTEGKLYPPHQHQEDFTLFAGGAATAYAVSGGRGLAGFTVLSLLTIALLNGFNDRQGEYRITNK